MKKTSRYYSEISLTGQVALVTGATSGIGLACARRLAEAECKLILIGRRVERLDALKKELESDYENIKVHVVQLDVKDIKSISKLPQTLPEEFKTVDILVNNAGLALGVNTIDGNDLEEAKEMLDTNVLAVLAFCRTFIPIMKAQGRGHVVNISSIAGHEAYGTGSVYCATKHAVDAISTASRFDLLDTPVRCTAISPGAVKTEFSVVRFKGDSDKADKVYEGFHPLLAKDIADNVMYALTRPLNVQVSDMIVLANAQASARQLSRNVFELPKELCTTPDE